MSQQHLQPVAADRLRRASVGAFTLVALTWGLMVFGASVRVHGAGLACPDWPLCFGQVIPPIDFGVFFEFGHRVVAGIVSLVFAALGVVVFRTASSGRTRALWVIGAVVLAIQVVLGGLTVLELLAEWTVTSHLLAGNTFCLLVLLVGLSLRADAGIATPLEPVPWVARASAAAVAVVLPIQVALGGLVSSSHAGLVCPSWPSCAGGAWFPTFAGLVGLQVTHRLVAYLLVAVILTALVACAPHRQLRRPVAALAALAILQVALGVLNVWSYLAIEVTLAHTGVAAWLVLCTTWLNWRAVRAPTAIGVTDHAAPLMEAR